MSEIEVPETIKETLMDGEEVLHFIQQSRLKKMITPESIFVTNKRVIKHIPKTFGLRRNIQDYKYVDMANTEIEQGLLFSNIKIKMRFGTEPVFLEMIPNNIAREVFATIQSGIGNRLAEAIPETVFKPPLTQAFVEKPKVEIKPDEKTEIETNPENQEDPLTILQRRYVTGGITKRKYLEMKKVLVPVTPKKPKKKIKKQISKRKKKS